jgi:hypothetical protein
MGSWISQESLEDAVNIPKRSKQSANDHDSASHSDSGGRYRSTVHVGSEMFMPFEIVHDNEHERTLSYSEAVRLRHG